MNIFLSIASNSTFILGTYSAQDYDLSEAEKYYTKLAWDLNEKVIKVGTDDWKKALNDLGADTSGYTDKPDTFYFGRSAKLDYDSVYDFDCRKLWSFLCAYYYDFDANDNSDIKYWKFNDDTKSLLEEIFNAEYEFQHCYDNTSHWEEHKKYVFEGGIDGTYWLVDRNEVYSSSFMPKSNPSDFENYKDNDGYLHFNSDLEILNAKDSYSRTGWYIQDQRYYVTDKSGQSSKPFYSWFDDKEYGRYYGSTYHKRSYWGYSSSEQIYWCVSPDDTKYWNGSLNNTCLISYYQKNYWKTDCRLYYNVKQKKTFDEIISEKLESMSHSDERLNYYDMLIGETKGNHQTINSPMGTGIDSYNILNGFGYDMQEWNIRHCEISDIHDGVDFVINSNSSLYAPFDCKISDVDTNRQYIVLRKNDVKYWYDGNGGTKRDTEIYFSNAVLADGLSKGDEIGKGDLFAVTANSKKCDDTANNTAHDYVHIKIKIDTDGYGWDFIDPRLVLY